MSVTNPFSTDLALVGAGYWGQNLARVLHGLGVLHTICDAKPATLKVFENGFDTVRRTSQIQDVFDNPTITKVAVATPAALHYQVAKAALLAGKDVYVEKPLCLVEREAAELVELASEKGRVLMVGHLLQYHPCIVKLQALLAQGELGKLFYVTSNRLNLGKIRKEENALWSFAPHDVSVILSLAGHQLPEQVRCVGGSYLSREVADTSLTSLKFADGLRAHIYVSWLNPFKEQKLTVVGSSGMVVFDDTRPWAEKLLMHRNYLTWADGQTPTPNKAPGERVVVEESEPLLNECRHFLECCRERRTPRTDGNEGLRVLRVLQMAQSSLEADGEPFRMRDTDHNADVPTSKSGNPELPAPDYFVHPTSIVDNGAQVGSGSKIWHFSHISSGVRIGKNCVFGQNAMVANDVIIGDNAKIQNNVSIYTGVTLEDDVFLGPSCVLTNVTNPRAQVNRRQLYERTIIKRGATIGANATIVCGITIGRYAFIAAGAVVTKNVPEYALMVGVPARQQGWMSRHGHILISNPEGISTCPESGLRYQEVSTGILRCLDLEEDLKLPAELQTGRRSYDEIKHDQDTLRKSGS